MTDSNDYVPQLYRLATPGGINQDFLPLLHTMLAGLSHASESISWWGWLWCWLVSDGFTYLGPQPGCLRWADLCCNRISLSPCLSQRGYSSSFQGTESQEWDSLFESNKSLVFAQVFYVTICMILLKQLWSLNYSLIAQKASVITLTKRISNKAQLAYCCIQGPSQYVFSNGSSLSPIISLSHAYMPLLFRHFFFPSLFLFGHTTWPGELPWPAIKSVAPTVEALSLYLWTVREVLEASIVHSVI